MDETARARDGFRSNTVRSSLWGRSQSKQRHSDRRNTTARRDFVYEFTSLHGVYHAYYNALFDLPKLAFQTATLSTYLSEGFPLPLIHFYLAMLLVNWSISFYRFQRQGGDRDLIITRLFYLFDLFFAVFAPIFVLAYAYWQFHMDRIVFAIREETLSPGSYDWIARLFADGFMHLQLSKTWHITVKCALNVLVLYKWKKVIVFLVAQRYMKKLQIEHQVVTTAQGTLRGETMNDIRSKPHLREVPRFERLLRTLRLSIRVHGKRRHMVFGVVAFIASMTAIMTYVSVSISSSQRNCAWHRADGDCSCIVFIDRDQAPRA